MDYIDEEEQESGLTKKKFLKRMIFLVGLILLMIGLFLFLEIRNKKHGKSEEKQKNEPAKKEAVSHSYEKPFILNDVKEGLKMEEQSGIDLYKKNTVRKNLANEKGNRICEYSEIDLPEIIEAGIYLDVRLSLGDGRNYTVLSSKKVGDFLRKDGKEIIWLSLSDEEIVVMDSAISDLSLFDGAKLYAVLHNEAGMDKMIENYPINYKTEKLIEKKREEGDLKEKDRILKDKELDEDRIRLIEQKNGRIGRWKEAVSYWEKQ